ncbi:hypothetical protein CY0110_16987 [Crocosphaera chwakensis CCY0110]|uniref:Uncharacterized protein n=1 Tax=Crocosphaera chwakensis CCY0110 TaxID=391612 RepID=A3II79_9CHRO|nr:hypothetical protein CY0110_16987 [Crocosphaera chwakensis CCY0110]
MINLLDQLVSKQDRRFLVTKLNFL